MAVSAAGVASELRRRLPGLGTKKLHKLLYYCQGHHLAALDVPLFDESISAWDMGPVVGRLWYDEKNGQPPTVPPELGEAELNTIGYVVSRYGRLTGADLERLTHAEEPWLRANRSRRPGTSARIEESWLREWFANDGEDEDDAVGLLDRDEVRAWLSGAEERRKGPERPDDLDELRARAARTP